MTLNFAELSLVVSELRAELLGARVERIQEPAAQRFVFHLRKPRAKGRSLLVDISPAVSRIHLTTRRFRSPPVPPRTCQFLRSRLEGAVLCGVALLESDRIVRLEFSGARGRFALVAELFGPNSNLCVLDGGGRIIFAVHGERLEKRGLGIGDAYNPPERSAPLAAREPRFPVDDEGSMSAAIDEFYLAKERDELLSRARRRLERELARGLAKVEKAIAEHERNIEVAREAARLRRKAEALLAFGKEIVKGSTRVVIPDPYEPGTDLTVELDPSLDAYENADRIFKRAKKLERARAVAEEAIDGLRRRAEQLRREHGERLQSLDSASLGELEVLAAGAVRTRRTRRAGGPREFISHDGLAILVGRSERENHELTFRIAAPDDLWLHVRQASGSHVVVRCGRADVPSQTLLDAANLALNFSSLKKSGEGEVVYTRRKHVRPVRGEQGKVVVTREKSIWVELDESRMRRLMASGRT